MRKLINEDIGRSIDEAWESIIGITCLVNNIKKPKSIPSCPIILVGTKKEHCKEVCFRNPRNPKQTCLVSACWCYNGLRHSKDRNPHIFIEKAYLPPGSMFSLLVHEMAHAARDLLGLSPHGEKFPDALEDLLQV